ncbi:DUF1385 domain-containing protein [Miniphocaeibacter halophilus]|uniref:DUF1385 domain-containing protein n=1 Tax=Miniphocaeibacter halophilus TaxID=2931922 RepID=A0AC61MQN0_9FIRM|nr:DUF1385 domain-containing protein [Miniphocaeibacter halophilus]QQK07912.1 DUF1385 domain-containing protein [Miniphocaeibacter halophilus]
MGVKKKTTIGGQALFEGILMRGPNKTSMVVRKPDGELEIKEDTTKPIASKSKIFRLPFIRGIISLIDSLYMGVNAIVYSTSFYDDEEDEEPGFLEKKFGDKAEAIGTGLSIVVSLALSILIFFFVPTIVTSFFKKFIENTILLNLIEGFIRILIFLAYIYLVSKMEDMKRIFMYHGAEHKSIHCYENGDELTVENVRKCSRLHRRCGTSFIFTVMIVSILVLSFFGWPNPFVRLLTRLLALPLIAGISYEINRLLGRSDSVIAEILSSPGLLIQKLGTVREPTDDMIEVAIVALKEVIPENEVDDIW